MSKILLIVTFPKPFLLQGFMRSHKRRLVWSGYQVCFLQTSSMRVSHSNPANSFTESPWLINWVLSPWFITQSIFPDEPKKSIKWYFVWTLWYSLMVATLHSLDEALLFKLTFCPNFIKIFKKCFLLSNLSIKSQN